jgi:hypothetical protein
VTWKDPCAATLAPSASGLGAPGAIHGYTPMATMPVYLGMMAMTAERCCAWPDDGNSCPLPVGTVGSGNGVALWSFLGDGH